jgi:hypothetical protein
VPYLGNDLQVAQPSYRNIDDISGSFNSSTTSFPLLVSGAAPVPFPINSNQCLISVAGVVQRPDDSGTEGFRISGGNIIFSSAPSTGADFFGVILAGADYVNVGANFPSGSAAVPSITFDSDLDTGIYNSAANQVSITTAGTERLRIDSAGQIEAVSLGTAAAPSFSFTTDPNTGIYSPGADQVAVATNGTARLYIASDGKVGVGTTSPGTILDVVGSGNPTLTVRGSDGAYTGIINIQAAGGGVSSINATGGGNALKIETNSVERARIDSSGRLLIGTSTARSNFFNQASTYTPQFQIETTGSNGQTMMSLTSSDTIFGPYLNFARQTSGSVGGNTAVSNNTALGDITFQGSDGAEFVIAAAIVATVDGTPGANDMPGRLVFSTTADGASSPTERMRITSNGYLKASNTGNYYSATSAFHEVVSSLNAATLIVQNSSASLTNSVNGVYIYYAGAAPNNTTAAAFYFEDTAGLRASIRSNGGLANYQANNVNFSDRNVKKNITVADDTWNCVKQWEIVKYHYKDQPDEADLSLGVIAQQVAESCPEVITVFQEAKEATEDAPAQEERLGVKEQQMMWMAIKALQAAQVRIEALEAEVAALKAQ